MAYTWLDLISGSARLIGVLASGETLSADEATNALQSLNDMIDTWSTESLLIFSNQEETFPLIASQQSYTMGVGGNFNTARPQKIELAYLRQVNGSTTYDLPIEILTKEQWSSITIKTTVGNIPRKLYATGNYPLDNILVWPIPSGTPTLVLWSWKPLTSVTSLAATVSLPPGYNKAIRYNLAVELAPEFGRPVDDLVIAQAVNAKAAIKRMNNKPRFLSLDPALRPKGSGFNWLTGE